MTLQKRLGVLEAVVEARVEERLEARVEEEITNFLSLLEQHLSREEFRKVIHIATWGPTSEAGDEGEG